MKLDTIKGIVLNDSKIVDQCMIDNMFYSNTIDMVEHSFGIFLLIYFVHRFLSMSYWDIEARKDLKKQPA